MNKWKALIVLTIVIGLALTACTPATVSPAPTTAPVEEVTSAPAGNNTQAADPKNATYLVDGKEVTLVNGAAETELAPGSASKQKTTYFGNDVQLDLNGDGLMDTAFLLTQDGGGSGTFFYIAAALAAANGTQGTNAIFLGDRIAPQSTNVDPNNPAQFVVNYAERKASEPMSAQPSVGVSRTFKYENGFLVEVGTPPTQVP